MSLKGVELQIAIPKTFDAGKVADQLQQQNSVNQANAQAASERQLEKNRETVTKSNNTAEAHLTDGERDKEEQERKKREKKEQEQKQAKHPFKGNFVDYSG
ncbi:RNA polymerase subunit sigma [Psychrobacillus vulpis]|uniref:RNA polymerase subunit sigma n=1 Tax=Psychrobacillus vulpis TaxID=2325572 RepID=A0A544TU53_9BACI|nr:RNA polymerase subunit sigma [Psychrobacillus vulpis]TQR20946.1 RNA polymerase subunit sigma [Psychrobacillus vulpis]